MKITILGSGSSGNSTLIEFEKTKILIDVGFSYKKIKEKLEEVNVSPGQIDILLISHDHVDHISGLKVFLNKHRPYVCISKKIFETLDYLQNYNKLKFLDEDNLFEEFKLIVIPASHDATDTHGFIIESSESLVYLTDTGYVNTRLFPFLENREYYIFESNHDPEMLFKGRYPVHIQHRIFGPKGHLSNRDCANYLAKLIGVKTKKVILAHISEDNNTEEKALETFHEVLEERGVSFESVSCAKHYEVVKVND